MTAAEKRTECELGPIRPPSEATSLLIRVTRNCPWNKCSFCPVYKAAKFSKRSEEEVIEDIDLLAEAAESVRSRAAQLGEIGQVSAQSCLAIMHDPSTTEDEKRAALWLHRGGEHVFLQDADSLAIPPHRVVRILKHLYKRFPSVNRVTTYARSRTLAVRSKEQLTALRNAGLTRIHVGLESGAQEVLKLVKKGCRPEHHIKGCRPAVEAGFEVCCYVMPGLGGRRYTEAHARETASVLREIDPQHVRLRTLWIAPGSPLEELYKSGEFELLEENEVVSEIRSMLKGLRGASGRVVSDHDLNLLMEIEGYLTDDADALDATCQQFLDLPQKTQDAFIVARRGGLTNSLNRFLNDPSLEANCAPQASKLREIGQGSLIKGIAIQIGRWSI
ncbi:MAG: radical SAM protein [Proteobacteria bacterium]|nr:radical SAM protein [Pseudomonadota bacterium]